MPELIADDHPLSLAVNRGESAYIVKGVNPADVPSSPRQAVEGSVFSAIGLPETQVGTEATRYAYGHGLVDHSLRDHG